MSRDGRYVVAGQWSRGEGTLNNDDYDIVRWERGGQRLVLDFPGLPSGISDDGSVIVGASGRLFARQAFRWTAADGVEYLAPNIDSSAGQVSGDGSTVLGHLLGRNPTDPDVPYRWTTTEGLQIAPIVPGADSTGLFGLSYDGSTMLGAASFGVGSSVSRQLYRWTEETEIWAEVPGMTGLFTPPPGFPGVSFTRLTPDLSAAGGWVGAVASSMQVPARWTEETGWVALPDLEGGDTLRNGPVLAWGISADGSILVGRGVDNSGPEPFIWDAVHGTRNLTTVLREDYGLGASLNGWNLTHALDISDDGRTILGSGTNPAGQREHWVAYLAEPTPNTWRIDANGDWVWGPNWTAGVSNVAGADVLFGNAITQPRTVTLNRLITVGHVQFDNANTYTIAGSNTLMLDATRGDAKIDVHSGNHVVSAPVTLTDHTTITVTPPNSNLSLTGALTATGQNLTKAGAGTLTLKNVRAAGLLIDGGTVAVAPLGTAAGTSVLSSLSIAGDDAPTARLDLNNNAAIIDYSGASPVATIRSQLLAGRGGAGLGKTGNGPGITSSAANAANTAEPESRSIGFAENASLPLGAYTTFRGQPVDDTSVLMAFTRTGDVNLDGIVDDNDVTIIGATYAPGVPQPSWALGDIDYNGFVDDDDVTLLGVFYDPDAPPLAAPIEGTAAGMAAVPEPSTFVLVAIAIAAVVVSSRLRRPIYR
ncbi:MAG: hypothetical protein WD894_00995 [Pirellulales bacterium]